MRFGVVWCWIYASKGILGITVESLNMEVVKALHMRFFVDNTSHIHVIVHHCEILSKNTCETSCWLDPPIGSPTSIMWVNGSFWTKLNFKDSDWAENFYEWSWRVGMCVWGVSDFSNNCRCLLIFSMKNDRKWVKLTKNARFNVKSSWTSGTE